VTGECVTESDPAQITAPQRAAEAAAAVAGLAGGRGHLPAAADGSPTRPASRTTYRYLVLNDMLYRFLHACVYLTKNFFLFF